MLDPLYKAQLAQTAHIPNSVLGNLTITHPYHPLNARSFDILMARQVNGTRRYSLRVGDNILCIPESWTDRCAIQPSQVESGAVIFNASHLAELVELLKSMKGFAEISAKPIDKPNN